MNDLTTEGASAPADDNALFDDVINGVETHDEPSSAAPVEQALQPEEPISATPPADPAIPPGVHREEKERRRAAERERDELRGRLAAFEQSRQQQPQAPRVDPVDRVLTDPTGLIREEAQSLVDPFDQRMSQLTEFYSRRDAFREHGQDTVTAAYQALDHAAKSGDQEAIATAERVKKSMDPYGDMVRWHKAATTLAETKGDLSAYRQRILDEAMKDPEYVRKVLETSRQTAHQTGNTVARPAVSAPPSLNRVGSAALPDNQEDVSDAQLFDSTTRRRRA